MSENRRYRGPRPHPPLAAPAATDFEGYGRVHGLRDDTVVCLDTARQTARHRGHATVDTGHFLIACAAHPHRPMWRLLEEMSADENRLLKYLTYVRKRDWAKGEEPPAAIPVSDELQRAVDAARDEARLYGETEVWPQHLALAAARDRDSGAVHLLERLGHPQAAVLRRILEVLGPSPFGRNLTQEALDGLLDPVVGRDAELERLILVLSRLSKNNPVLIGERGVGKTALLNGLALRMAAGTVPSALQGRRLFTIDWHELVTKVHTGQHGPIPFEERLRDIFDRAATVGTVLLCVSDADRYLDFESREAPGGVGAFLWSLILHGRLQVILSMLPADYHRYAVGGSALETHCQPISLPELSVEQTGNVLRAVAPRYERHHRVRVSDEAVAAVASLADRYIVDRYLPAKAVELLDETCAFRRVRALSTPDDRDAVVEVAASDVTEALSAMTGTPVGEIHQPAASEDALSRLRTLLDQRAAPAVHVPARLPERPASTAILIGTGRYRSPAIPDIPAIPRNLADLRTRLSAFDPARVHTFADPSLEDLPRIAEAAESTSDTLLVYYAGHGFAEPDGELYLGLPATEPERRKYSTLPYDRLRSLVLDSPARNRLVVLDCCFSGRAIGTLTGDGDTPGGQLDISGTYILTATSPTRLAHAAEGARNSAFTGELLSLLHDGIDNGEDLIRVAHLYTHLRTRLTAKGLPVPQQRGTDTIGDLAIARNPWIRRA